MKTFTGKIDGCNVVVKVYFRSCDDDLQDVAKKLSHIWYDVQNKSNADNYNKRQSFFVIFFL